MSQDQTAAVTAEAAKLAKLGFALPEPPGPLGAYSSWTVTGSLIMTSGQFPWVDGRLAFTGRVGGDLSPEQGYHAFQLAAVNAIAQLRAAAGSLDRIRIIRLEGTMQVAPGFLDGPAALNGASDIFNEVFGERGRHTRMIYTNPEMPLNSPVLLVVFAEILSARPASPGVAEHLVGQDFSQWPQDVLDELRANETNGRVGQTLVSETEDLRVWHLTLSPGESLPFHRHVLDYFWTATSPGRARSYFGDGQIKEFSYEIGDTSHFHFERGAFMLHNLVNIGDGDLSFVTVEHKRGSNLPLDIGQATTAG